jgi:hypothetical protein
MSLYALLTPIGRSPKLDNGKRTDSVCAGMSGFS